MTSTRSGLCLQAVLAVVSANPTLLRKGQISARIVLLTTELSMASNASDEVEPREAAPVRHRGDLSRSSIPSLVHRRCSRAKLTASRQRRL